MVGKFIVIEGTDGSGKGLQFRKAIERLRKERVHFETADFPQYEKPSSYFVKEYLTGKYGSSSEVEPRVASLFYALDRYDEAPTIRSWLSQGRLVLSNRYTTSNIGHQGAKATSANERAAIITYIEKLEYGLLGIPKPNKVILLSVHPFVAQQLVSLKQQRAYLTGGKRDIHEEDIDHLRKAAESYRYAARHDKSWVVIDCMRPGLSEKRILSKNVSPLLKVKSIEEIHELVWKEIRTMLPPVLRRRR